MGCQRLGKRGVNIYGVLETRGERLNINGVPEARDERGEH